MSRDSFGKPTDPPASVKSRIANALENLQSGDREFADAAELAEHIKSGVEKVGVEESRALRVAAAEIAASRSPIMMARALS